jgi:hypothetical protein
MFVSSGQTTKFDGYGDIWKDILSPFKKVGSVVETKIIRPTIGAKGIGKPLASAGKFIEKKIIDPTLKPLIKPLAKVMPKITIGGHRYDLGGSQALQKTATGAVSGFAVGGIYGAVVGGLAANLQHGKPNVLQDLVIGAAAGYAAGTIIAGSGGGAAATAAGSGTTAGAGTAGAGTVTGAGTAAGAGGGGGAGLLTTVSQGVGVASTAVGIGQKTGLLSTAESRAAERAAKGEGQQQLMETMIADDGTVLGMPPTVGYIAIGTVGLLIVGGLIYAMTSKPKVLANA